MTFKKGSKVEVLCKREDPFGAWRCAEIVSRDGQAYNVKYECNFVMANWKTVDKFSRKAIRPCPPSVDSMMNWSSGNIVEVLDAGSWKIATVSKVVDADFCLVRLLGSSKEIKAHKSETRVRKTWQDDKWVVFGKAYGNIEVATSNNLNCREVPLVDTRIKDLAGNDGLAPQEKNYLLDSYIVSTKSLKRSSPFCSSFVEAHPSKLRAFEKQNVHQQVVSRPLSYLHKMVDADASQPNNLVENDLHAPAGKQTIGNLETKMENTCCGSSWFVDRSPEYRGPDSDSDSCSVGSCSVNTNGIFKLSSRFVECYSKDAHTHCSDAESSCGFGNEEKGPLPLKEDEASRIHRLELHAYHSTLVAMHASGPLSWDQEALLTNLRITLHISNDEHLMELRNLISSGKPSSYLAYNRCAM